LFAIGLGGLIFEEKGEWKTGGEEWWGDEGAWR
jgi:hypothetical protein